MPCEICRTHNIRLRHAPVFIGVDVFIALMKLKPNKLQAPRVRETLAVSCWLRSRCNFIAGTKAEKVAKKSQCWDYECKTAFPGSTESMKPTWICCWCSWLLFRYFAIPFLSPFVRWRTNNPLFAK